MASQREIDDLEEESIRCDSSKQMKTKSKVWEEMKKIKTSDGYKVQCMHCGKLMSALGGTSHLRRHLLTCPKRPSDLENEQHRAIEEERKFRQLMQAMNPEFKNLSRHTIKRDLMSSYKKEKEVVKSELSEVVGRISLTADNWRSEHTMDEYTCVTAHWIDANWKLHKKASGQFPILASMARDILAIPISTVASESTFSIEKKLISPWRSSLKPNIIQALICLEDWTRTGDGNIYNFY
ncbi:zinc finger BED domain-containing protein DAYSLEEPER-like [Senna tora]|uniref:Zinc finger BED domain-containing protein DAYSLEEPER-like n=1 Tax=Senna tora TaxID=362788 RepID=A0A834W100_9FABA|nr:zinc finger BED domain-containing protein DAYSLEEPER-like [Senna tora]